MSRAPHDLTGRRFGRLVALRRTASRGGVTHWLCLCDCAREHVASTASLRAGDVQSCGCLRRELSSARARARATASAAKRARDRALYGEGFDKPNGYCCKPTRFLKPRPAAVRDLASALGLDGARLPPGLTIRVHRLEEETAA